MISPTPGDDTHPLISVMTIFLDEERFIQEAVESVLTQSYTHWELLLIDDGSTDASTAIAVSYAAQYADRIRYLEHPGHENRGMGASRELALEHASGKYLCFLDADDVYLPRKLERQVAVLEAMPHVGLLYGATEYWYSWNGGASGRADDEWRRFGAPAERVIEPPELLLHFLRDGRTLPCMGSVLVRCSVAREAGGFDKRFRGLYEDQAFLATVGLTTPAYIIPECHDRYRQHPDSTCHQATSAEKKAAGAAYLAWLRDRIEQGGVRHDGLKRALDAAEATLEQDGTKSPGDRNADGLESLVQRAWMAFSRPPVRLARAVKKWPRWS